MSFLTKAAAAAACMLIGAFATIGVISVAGAGVPGFSDVPPSHPFYEDITWAASTGVANGFPGGEYRPGGNVTRQAMAAFLHRASTYDVVTEFTQFTNVNNGTVVVSCPGSDDVIAGGVAGNAGGVFVTDSHPLGQYQWSVRVETDNAVLDDFGVTAYAICGPVDLNNDAPI